MNYVYMISGIVLALIAAYVLLQVKGVRDKANALFLEAEKNITDDKLEYVAYNLYDKLPSIVRLFVNPEGFIVIVQKIYDKTRRLAQDVLNDGKFNGK